jgi:CspA family cold shock protein
MRTGHCRGTVRRWSAGEGWGVVDAPDTPGGTWVAASAVERNHGMPLRAGQTVALEFEVADHEGFRYRATRVVPDDELGSSVGG